MQKGTRGGPLVGPVDAHMGPVSAHLPPPIPTLVPLSFYTLPTYIRVLSNRVRIFFRMDPIEPRICPHPVS